MAQQASVHVFVLYHDWHSDLGQGWGTKEETCPYCRRYYIWVAPIQSLLPPCPYCGLGETSVLVSCDKEQSDGPWLTGEYEIQGVADEDAD